MEAAADVVAHAAKRHRAQRPEHHLGRLRDRRHPVQHPAAAALERACGTAPAFVRSGGSIPIVADFGAKGIPTIVTGFVLPDDPFHAPDESFSLRGLELGYKSARELLIGLADLKAE